MAMRNYYIVYSGVTTRRLTREEIEKVEDRDKLQADKIDKSIIPRRQPTQPFLPSQTTRISCKRLFVTLEIMKMPQNQYDRGYAIDLVDKEEPKRMQRFWTDNKEHIGNISHSQPSVQILVSVLRRRTGYWNSSSKKQEQSWVPRLAFDYVHGSELFAVSKCDERMVKMLKSTCHQTKCMFAYVTPNDCLDFGVYITKLFAKMPDTQLCQFLKKQISITSKKHITPHMLHRPMHKWNVWYTKIGA